MDVMGTNLPPLEPLNVTLSREGRGIVSASVILPASPEESFRQFAYGNLSDLAKRSIGNAQHLADAYRNAFFAEFALRRTAEEIVKHGLPRNERANAAGVALLGADVALHGALLTHLRDGWMQLNALNLCRASIEGAAKACFIALGTKNEVELWEGGDLKARPAIATLSTALSRLRRNGADAMPVYEWLCRFTHGEGSIFATGRAPSTEDGYAAFAFVSWACAAVAEIVIGTSGYATFPSVLPVVLPWASNGPKRASP